MFQETKNKPGQEFDFYRSQGIISDPKEYDSMLDALPDTVPEIVAAVQGLFIHIFWAQKYGLELTPEQREQVQLRFIPKILRQITLLDQGPLNRPRTLERRFVGNCRDHAVFMCAVLRHKGIPARARCGFARYFVPNHYEDHWICEYWDRNRNRWLAADPQLDGLQREALQISFDPLDLPPGEFLSGAEAWVLCRNGAADPDHFGIFDMKGLGFVRGNLVRDIAALNKVELLPWDCWGIMERDFTTADNAFLDRAATIVCKGEFPEIAALYEGSEVLRVPRGIHSYQAGGMREIRLAEE